MFRTLSLGIPMLILVFCTSFLFAEIQELQVAGSGYFGATFQMDPVSKNLTREASGDAIIKKIIQGSPAEEAKFLIGDIIVAVNEFGVDGGGRFVHFLARTTPKQKLSCLVLRIDPANGKEVSRFIEVTLGTHPKTLTNCPPIFGMELNQVENQVIVQHVRLGSSSYNAKIQKGDHLLSFNGRSLKGDQDYEVSFADFLRGLDPQGNEESAITFMRDGKEHRCSISPQRKGHLGMFLNQDGKKGRVFVDELFPIGPAASAGLEVNDRIVKIDGEQIRRARRVGEIITTKGKNGVISLEIKRKNETLQKKLTIGGRAGY